MEKKFPVTVLLVCVACFLQVSAKDREQILKLEGALGISAVDPHLLFPTDDENAVLNLNLIINFSNMTEFEVTKGRSAVHCSISHSLLSLADTHFKSRSLNRLLTFIDELSNAQIPLKCCCKRQGNLGD